MLALPLVLMLASATPSIGPREARDQRAARLMTEGELSQFTTIDHQLELLGRPGGNMSVFVSSLVLMGGAVILPLVMGVVGAVGSVILGIFGGLGALLGSTALLSLVPQMWVALFGWIPVWGWVAMGVAAVVGGGMLIGAMVGDAPRREEVQALRRERNLLLKVALSRPESTSMLEVPLTTVATF